MDAFNKISFVPTSYDMITLQSAQAEFETQCKQGNFGKLDHMQTYIKEMNFVANEQRTKKHGNSKSSQQVQWVNVSINIEDFDDVSEWIESNIPDVAVLIAGIVSEGFSLSVKPSRDETYMGSVVGLADFSDGPKTIGVTARAADAQNALLGVLFKFIVILDYGNEAEALQPAASGLFS